MALNFGFILKPVIFGLLWPWLPMDFHLKFAVYFSRHCLLKTTSTVKWQTKLSWFFSPLSLHAMIQWMFLFSVKYKSMWSYEHILLRVWEMCLCNQCTSSWIHLLVQHKTDMYTCWRWAKEQNPLKVQQLQLKKGILVYVSLKRACLVICFWYLHLKWIVNWVHME